MNLERRSRATDARFALASALIAAVLAASGCVPQLDTTGRIRCGAAGECPSGWQCVGGRCCPSDNVAACAAAVDAMFDGVDDAANDSATDTPADVRPDSPPVDVVSDTTVDAPIDSLADAPVDAPTLCGGDSGVASCGAGRECREGYCCDVSAGAECPPGAIGSRCSAGAECIRVPGSVAACATNTDTDPALEYPGGYCTATCNPAMRPDPCAPMGACVAYGLSGACARFCSAAQEGMPCRGTDPYVCRHIDVGSGGRAYLCLPDCVAGADCDGDTACYRPRRHCRSRCSAMSTCILAVCEPSDNVCLPYCTFGCPTGLVCGGSPTACR